MNFHRNFGRLWIKVCTSVGTIFLDLGAYRWVVERFVRRKAIVQPEQLKPDLLDIGTRHAFHKVMLDGRGLIDEVKARLPSENHRPHANVGRIGLVFNLLEPTLDEVAGDLPLFGNLEVGPRAFGNEAVVSRVF